MRLVWGPERGPIGSWVLGPGVEGAGRTVVLGVPEGPDVQEGGADPVQGHADVTDGLQDDLCIQVFHQVAVEAGDMRGRW